MKAIKTKGINYISILGVVGIMLYLSSLLTISFWRFDITKISHLRFLLQSIINGKVLGSAKYIALISTMMGCLILTFVISDIIYHLDFTNILQKKQHDLEKETLTPEVKAITIEYDKVKDPLENENIVAPFKVDNSKFDIYNNATKTISEISTPEIQSIESTIQPINEDEEKEKLNQKIKEVMARMQKKHDAEPKDIELSKPTQKILTPAHFDDKSKSEKLDMNFKKITDDQNSEIESSLTSAGFKVLSEIRIGDTGIDYMGVADNQIAIVQLDTTSGNWMASEDSVDGQAPYWFSENGTKVSPIARAIEARKNISDLLKGTVDFPIKTYACFTQSSIMNYIDVEDEWKQKGVDVISLHHHDMIDSRLADTFPKGKWSEIDADKLDTIIQILEYAEIPE